MTARRFLAPEVIQTSEMDCGPATLKCILEGFGIPVSYGRLREACQTDVDGTSIDTMEEVANQLGLEAEQTMVPEDHLLLPEAETLPAIVITTNPNGLTHFVVVWRIHGPFIQVMDPAVGRRWLTKPRFLRDLFIHTMPFPAAAWRAWAGTRGFGDPLLRRMLRLELPEPVATRLLETALADESWRGLAALDAATRLVTSLVQANGLLPGPEAERLLAKFFDQTQADPAGATRLIPEPYWTVRPGPVEPAAETDADEGEDELILLRGAVLVRMLSPGSVAPVDHQPEVEPQPLSPELAAALAET
ncbi:MAG TPA: cysteine peptidase family C39 domain-containing protein, partial [Anaerolineae bacterium]|nr:cysteine peptidase family C39 domain-containing protein [Anaerolineae bacterium]